MISFQFILFLHILLASTSICLFLFRAIRALLFRRVNQLIQLKKLSIGIDSLLMITGMTQIIYLNYQPLSQYWFWAKMSLLIIYILTGIQTLKTNQSSLQRTSFLTIAFIAASLIVYLAINKPF